MRWEWGKGERHQNLKGERKKEIRNRSECDMFRTAPFPNVGQSTTPMFPNSCEVQITDSY